MKISSVHTSEFSYRRLHTLDNAFIPTRVLLLDDLEHQRAVKPDRHTQFAKSKDMLSYFVSAKTGESVEHLFRQVTAHLMHIVLPKNDYDATKIIRASITRQESQGAGQAIVPPTRTRTSICTLQWSLGEKSVQTERMYLTLLSG